DRRVELSAARARRPLARKHPLQAEPRRQSHSTDPEASWPAAKEWRRRSRPRLIANRQTGEFCGATFEENRGAIDTYVQAAQRLHKSRGAIRQMALRGQLQRVRGNDGK